MVSMKTEVESPIATNNMYTSEDVSMPIYNTTAIVRQLNTIPTQPSQGKREEDRVGADVRHFQFTVFSEKNHPEASFNSWLLLLQWN